MGFMEVVALLQALELSLAAIAAVLDLVLWCFSGGVVVGCKLRGL
jgi:hypothetical protein